MTKRLGSAVKSLGWPPFWIAAVLLSIAMAVMIDPPNQLTSALAALGGSGSAFLTDPMVLLAAVAVIVARKVWLCVALACCFSVALQALAPSGFHGMWKWTACGRIVAILSLAAVPILILNLIKLRSRGSAL